MKKDERICYGCMSLIPKDTATCPVCRFNLKKLKQNPRCLPPGTSLQERYIVGKVIGEGGFGITYIGFDTRTEEPIAIKEYFPSKTASRDCTANESNDIFFFEEKDHDKTKGTFEKYITEAKTLMKFSYLEGIVSTKDFFYENHTAYIIMEYVEGISLKQYLRTNGTLTPRETFEYMMPVMYALEQVHAQGIIHRDISPDNIMIRVDGSFKLIDFGAARLHNDDDGASLTVILKRGFAPEEQYRQHGKQGPWTDIYALCATMYQMMTNVVPPEAMERIVSDSLVPLNDYNIDISQKQIDAIHKGLSLNAEDRFSSIKELRQALSRKKIVFSNHDIHAIAIFKEADDSLYGYRLYDSGLKKTVDLSIKQLLTIIIKNKLHVVNLKVDKGCIQPLDATGEHYPVLRPDGSLITNDRVYFYKYNQKKGFKFINYKGQTSYFSHEQLPTLVANESISNIPHMTEFLSTLASNIEDTEEQSNI